MDEISRYARTEAVAAGDTPPAWRLAMTSVEVVCAAVVVFLLGSRAAS